LPPSNLAVEFALSLLKYFLVKMIEAMFRPILITNVIKSRTKYISKLEIWANFVFENSVGLLK
jgi:hypothetical protein